MTLGGATMGTTWSVALWAPTSVRRATIAAAIDAELAAVVEEMSSWSPTSALSRFAQAPAGGWRALPARFGAVMAAALAVAADSDGAFDPAIGALVDLWGFGPRPACDGPPDAQAVADALARGGWRRLRLAQGRLFQPGGVALDLSGIAKGFAVDQVAARLARAGAASALVEIGGELAAFGVKPDGLPWWVELETPADAASVPPATLALCGAAVATSGGYRRFRVVEGVRVQHTLDPRTGRPVDNGVIAVSVLHASCLYADAYATAIAVLGQAAGLAFATRLGLAARLVVDGPAGPSAVLTPALAAMLD
ncbi:MAG: FAD:protein FMN transferase [Hyphomonadaceae bacterium]|nr:FAD:protein FMN transferase [Hyphomonadaceae bacterium]